MAETKIVTGHEQGKLIHAFAWDPDHANRRETRAYRDSQARLKADGHYFCFVCGTTENIETHHFGCEYMFENIVDYKKLEKYLLSHDLYGYTRLLKNIPLTTVDDVRNLQCLCKTHHIGVHHADAKQEETGIGIHAVDEPTFNIQIVALDGANPVPQRGETWDDVAQRIKEFERSA